MEPASLLLRFRFRLRALNPAEAVGERFASLMSAAWSDGGRWNRRCDHRRCDRFLLLRGFGCLFWFGAAIWAVGRERLRLIRRFSPSRRRWREGLRSLRIRPQLTTLRLVEIERLFSHVASRNPV